MGIVHRIHSLAQTCNSDFMMENSTPPKEIRWVSWEAPDDGRVKLNVYGSSFGNPGRPGFCRVIRDPLGRWMIGFVGSIGEGTNLLAELQAIKHGLRLSWTRGAQNLVCESYFLEVVEIIKTANIKFHAYASVISDIRFLLR